MERAITLPFSIDESGSVLSSNDPRVIWQSRVIAAVMTELGERVFRPSYGGTINSSVFETEEMAKGMVVSSISSVFGSYLTSLSLIKVESSMDSQFGALTVTIYYTLPNNQEDQVTVKTGTVNRSGEITQEY